MNPQSDQTPGLRLPQPSFDVGQPAASMPQAFQAPAATPMQQPGMPMPSVPAVGMPMAPQSAPAMPVPPSAVQIQPQVAQLAPAAAPVQEPVQADDESALDQEWVTKAREVVERTHGDPYLESNELSKIKAQYIKVRYNKDIKVTED